MKRKESQSLNEEREQAIKKGYASNCIGKVCVCWNFCSYQGRIKPTVCCSDLSTGFYRFQDLGFDPYEHERYKDPNRKPKPITKKRKKH